MKKHQILNFIIITIGTIALIVGNYYFKFPNKFIFGGVAGIAVLLGEVTPWSVGTVNLVINMVFLILGFMVLGKKFGVKTTYVSILMSVGISILEKVQPIAGPLTNQPVLEFTFAIILTAVGAGLLFHCDASSGGTDIPAIILKKYTGANIGKMVLLTDVLITVFAFFVFNIQVALFSILGLIVKSILIDNTIDSMNRYKYLMIICNHTEPLCDYIINDLKKGATVCQAQGAYTHQDKYLIICVLKGKQEIQLRQFIKHNDPSAFILVSNSSQIFGKGFLSNN